MVKHHDVGELSFKKTEMVLQDEAPQKKHEHHGSGHAHNHEHNGNRDVNLSSAQNDALRQEFQMVKTMMQSGHDTNAGAHRKELSSILQKMRGGGVEMADAKFASFEANCNSTRSLLDGVGTAKKSSGLDIFSTS